MGEEVSVNSRRVPDTEFSKLRQSLLMLNLQKEMDEPGYAAIERITFERKVFENRYIYAGEIERVLNELKLTSELIANVNEKLTTKHKTHEPEDLINYYNGIFLDLVHQFKDKLLRLLDLMFAEPPFPKAYSEPENMRLASFLKKNKDKLGEIGVYELLKKLEQSDNPIGVVLKRRTQHHHFASRLALNSDYQKIRMSKIMLQPTPTQQLTEDGKTRMEKLGKDAYDKLRSELVKKQQKTITEIEYTVERMADALIKHFKIETNPIELAKIMVKYTEFLGSMNIENKASKDKIKSPLDLMVYPMVEFAEKELGNIVVSIYLVGSAARNEFKAHISDINFYIITNGYSKTFGEYPVDATFINEADLFSEIYKKDRFIIWSDGVLLYGKDISFDEKEFPKPGTLLTLLLNREYKSKLEAIKVEVMALDKPDDRTLRIHSVKMAKIIMDFGFGVAMANKPYYTASRKKKIEYTKISFPNQNRTIIMEQIYDGAVVKQDDFPIVIDTFIESVERSFNKMLIIEKEVNDQPAR